MSMTAAASWQPVPLDAEFSPEVAAALLSDRGRRELSSLLRSRDEALRTKVRKHLVALGWTIVSRRNAVMAPRMRYESPANGNKTYCSLPDLIVDALISSNEPHQPPPETKNNKEEEQDAIAEYVALMASDDRGAKAKGPRADRLRARAKSQLQASGWSFWVKLKSDGREELRYKAPTGRFYISLHTACQAFIISSSQKSFTATSSSCCSRKKREISELITTTIETKKKKKKKISCEAVGADGITCLVKKSTTTTNISKRRKKKKAAGASRVLRPNCEVSASAGHARTLLSVLIDEGILVPRDKVTYRAASGGAAAKGGLVTGDGVRCTCCGRAFTVAEFEAHATRGSRTGRPWARLFLNKDGRSLSQCLVELMRRDSTNGFHHQRHRRRRIRVKEACRDPGGDSVCSVCNDGGELLLCDHCPSAFHHDCLGLPGPEAAGGDDDWFCPCCRCGACGGTDFDDPAAAAADDDTNTSRRSLTDKTVVYCEQCEREYHVGCVDNIRDDDDQPWVCSPGCGRVFRHLQDVAGTSIPTSAEGVSLAILRRRRRPSCSSDSDSEEQEDEALAHGKLRAALDVLHECFVPLVEPRTQSDLSADMVFNRESELRRLHVGGYYVVGLEKGGELVTVGTLRVYGDKVAELPLVGTRFAYRRQGMLRLLMTELEKMLARDLGVQRLVLPAVPELLRMWTASLGFSAMTHSDKLEIIEHTILCFQGTTMCQKTLLAPAAAASSS
ncbi:increased DNA methylation 1 [Panicum miliaceum]|uniref:Increased DNA methylation 1 n=1 Tax=Panicum miliaceum TaxID=4540 RepID=A0A3L6T957_PANMI|nr:increased DNA methylation 1 [Panicum miliaceum]